MVCTSLVFGQRPDFFREDITFRLDSTFLSVEGFYWFANHSDATIHSEIFYPFPYEEGEFVDSIRVYHVFDGCEVRYRREGVFGIAFPLHLSGCDTVLLQIRYRQKIKERRAVYILKTTQGWGKPLDVAEFKLITPITLYIQTFSYPPDTSYRIQNLKINVWKKEQFMPEQDMVFEF